LEEKGVVGEMDDARQKKRKVTPKKSSPAKDVLKI